MKPLFLSLMGIYFSLVASSAEPASATDRTTVMVYMNAKNNLDCAAIDDLKEMASAFPLAHVTVVVEVGRLPFNKCAGEDPGDVWSGTLFFRLPWKKGLNPSFKQALRRVPEKPTSPGLGAKVDMGDSQTLRRFVTWAERNYPADHYVLVIWGHGHGYRLENTVLSTGGAAPVSTGNGYRAVSFDDEFQSYLFTHDFQEALAGTRKLDVLAFDSCLMAGIETAYAVRNLAAVMVGSEELEPTGGWNYTNVLRGLSRNHNRTPRSLGVSIVESARDIAGEKGNPVTLSAIDLSKVDPVVNQISHLADVMMAALTPSDQSDDHSETIRLELSRIRDKCRNYGKADGFHDPIDLINFIELLAHKSPTSKIQRASEKLLRVFVRSRIMIDNYATDAAKLDFGSNGLTIYFPPSPKWYNNDPDDHGEGYSKCLCGIADKHPVDFVCRLNWSSFLRVYFLSASNNVFTAGRTIK